jgi:hypothetical protein
VGALCASVEHDPNEAVVYNKPSPLGKSGCTDPAYDLHPKVCWCGSPHRPSDHPYKEHPA